MGTADTTLGTASGDVTSVTSSADTTSGSGSTGSSGGTGSSSAGTDETDTTTGVETTGTGSSSTDAGSSSDDGPACVLPDESSSDGGEPPLDLGLDGGCGNGVVEDAEFCDDGNQEPGDGCEVDCTSSDDVPTEFFLTMGGPNGFGDLGSGVAFDSQGNLIISGFVANEVWIRKYDVDYEELWTVTYPGHVGNLPSATVVAVDSQDNIAFAGSTGELDNGDWIFGLLDPDGMELWSETLDGPVGRNDYPYGVAVDGEDAIVFVGARENPINGSEAVILKYGSAGDLLWSQFSLNGGAQPDSAAAVGVDPCDALVVTTSEFNADTGLDVAVRKFDPDGGLLWERFEATPFTDYGVGVGIDAVGGIVVVGGEIDPGSNYFDFWARRYDPDGATLWTRSSDGGASMSDMFSATVVAPDGTAWSAGIITPFSNDTRAVIRRHDAAGEAVWTRLLELEGSGDGWLAIARAPDGRIGVAGASQLPFPNDVEAHFGVYPP